MANTHNIDDKATFPVGCTAAFIAAIFCFALLAVSTNPRQNWKQYQPKPFPVVAATALPAPLNFAGKPWIPVEDPVKNASGLTAAGSAAGGLTVYRSSDPGRIYVGAQGGPLQPYIPQQEYLAQIPQGQAGAQMDLPAAFRFRGYTWHQNSNTISKDDSTEPMMKIGSVLGHAILASEPGPEAHRNSVYVEVRPGSADVQPYVPLEALYSTSDQGSSGMPGLGGKLNPYPTVDGPSLPYGPVEDPNRAHVPLEPTGPGGSVPAGK